MTRGPERQSPPADTSRRSLKAALLRPWGLIVLAIGGFFFAATLEWWIIPLTLATYASLVFLATRETPRSIPPGPRSQPQRAPDQRVHRLPHGETRRKAEAALEAYGRVLTAIEGSEEKTRALLSNTIPKLRRIADRLLDIAEAMETPPDGTRHGESERTPTNFAERLHAADEELSGAADRLLRLRTQVVRVSIEGGEEAVSRAAELASSLDEWNLRLDALNATPSSPGEL